MPTRPMLCKNSDMDPEGSRSSVLTSLSVCEAGLSLTGYSNGIVKLWDPNLTDKTGPTQLKEFRASHCQVSAVALSSRGHCAGTGDKTGSVKMVRLVWAPSTWCLGRRSLSLDLLAA